MAESTAQAWRSRLDFLGGEAAGALGDSVTVLPVVFAVGALSGLSLGAALLWFGAFQVVWGLRYRLPVSVEPMKALAALVIAGALTAAEFAVAGLLAGTVLLVAGRTGSLERLQSVVGRPVVRGVQLAVALVLLERGLVLGAEAPVLAVGAALPALGLAVAGYRRAVPLVVLGVGGALAVSAMGAPEVALPAPTVGLPAGSLSWPAVLGATAGQLAMTVGNAAVATSLLLADYYDADVSPDALAESMGAMNLLAIPLGGFPMCHGSGGVAGKHAFGARTAGANLLLGGGYAAAALVAVDLAAAFPMAVLGVVLAAVAVELGRTGLDTDHLGVTLLVGVVGAAVNVGAGFLAGLAVAAALRRCRSGGDDGRDPRT